MTAQTTWIVTDRAWVIIIMIIIIITIIIITNASDVTMDFKQI